MFYPKYGINYLPNQAGDTTAFAVLQLIRERNYMYRILNNMVAGKVGFIHAGVRVATTENVRLSGLQTIDGVQLADGDRVLVWKQTDAKENGVYAVRAEAWERAGDAAQSADFAGGFYTSVEGGTYAGGLFTTIGDVEIGEKPVHFRRVLQGDEVATAVLAAEKNVATLVGGVQTSVDRLDAAEKALRQDATNLAATQKQADESATRAEAALNRAETAQKQAESARNTAGEYATKAEEWDAKIRKNATRIETAAQAVAERQTELAQQVDETNRVMAAARTETETIRAENATITKQINALAGDVKQAKNSVENNAKQVSALHAEAKTYRDEAEQARTSAEAAARKVADMQAAVSAIQLDAQDAAKRAEAARDRAEQAKIATDEAQGKATQAVNTAQAQAQSAAKFSTAAEAAKQVAESAATRAESAKQETQTASTQAQTAAKAATTAQGAAERAKQNTETVAGGARESAQAAALSAKEAKEAVELAKGFTGGNYYSKSESDGKYQPKGNYVTTDVVEQHGPGSKIILGANMHIDSDFRITRDTDDTILIRGDGVPFKFAGGIYGYYTQKESDARYQPKGTYASVEYVDGRVANIVKSAPEALDTLQELAQALGNDANFATTVSRAIGTKADKDAVENSLKGKANVADVYTKAQADGRYLQKGDKLDAYTKAEADRRFASRSDVEGAIAGKASAADVYTKGQADALFARAEMLNTLFGQVYTKATADARFIPQEGATASEAEIVALF